MDIGEILKDSLKYPIKDSNKFFKLAIPTIIIGVLFEILELIVTFSNPEGSSDPIYLFVGLIGIVTILLIFIVALIDSGMSINIIRNNIRGINELPDLEIGRFTLDGLKTLIVVTIYFIVPSIIILFLSTLFISLKLDTVAYIIFLLFYVLIFIISLLVPAIYGRLAETNSMSQALSVSEIWNITKRIGFGKVFATLIIMNLITSLLTLLSILLFFVPVIGIILIAVLIAYYMMFHARCYALLYLDKDYNMMSNQPYNNNQYQQNNYNQYNQQNNSIDDNYQIPENQINQEANNPLDFQNKNENQQNNNNDFKRPNNTSKDINKLEICPNCGGENREDATYCIICGEEL